MPLPQSTLKLAIDAIPDDFVSKGRNVTPYLKKRATPLTGQPLKDEELDFSGFSKLDPLKRYTKKDLQELEAARTDIHVPPSTMESQGQDFSTYTLKEFDLTNYEERGRYFSRLGDNRQVYSHFPEATNYRSHTRRTIDQLDGEQGRIVFELQSDLHQRGRAFGYTYDEAKERRAEISISLARTKEEVAKVDEEIRKVKVQRGGVTNRGEATPASSKSFQQRLDTLTEQRTKLVSKMHVDEQVNMSSVNNNLLNMEDSVAHSTNSAHAATSPLPEEKIRAAKSESSEYYQRGADWINTPEAMADILKSDWPGAAEARRAVERYGQSNGIPLGDALLRDSADMWGDYSDNVPEFKKFLVDFDKQMEAIYSDAVISPLEKARNAGNQEYAKAIVAADTAGSAVYETSTYLRTSKERILQSVNAKEPTVNDKMIIDALVVNNEKHYDAIIEQEQKKRISTLFNKDDGSQFPKKTPFASNSLEKDLEQELAEAQLSGLKFVAIPLEVGSDDLARGKSVQKRYETVVRAKMKHMVENLNKGIDQQAIRDGKFELIKDDKGAVQKPIVDPSEYFTYSEVKVPVRTTTGQSPARTLNGMNDGQLMDFARDYDLVNPEEIDGNIRELLTNAVQDLSPERVTEIFGYTKVPSNSHTMGKIALPTAKAYKTTGINQISETAPKWIDNLRLYSAAPAGLSIPQIHEALRTPGVSSQNLEDHLVNNQGRDRDEINNAITTTMRAKVKDGLDMGLSVEELTDGMFKAGYKMEDIEQAMPKQSVLETIEAGQEDFMKNQMLSFDFLKGELNPLYNSEYEKSAEARSAMAVSANETVLKLWDDLGAPLSRQLKVKAKTQSLAMNAEIMRTLSQAGIEAQVTDKGDILVPDSNGTLAPLDVGVMDSLLAHSAEIINSIAGGIAGAKVGGLAPGALKGPGFVVGATVGSAIGAFSGRGMDILRNRLYNKQELDAKFMWDEMLATGAADAVIGFAIPAGIKITGALAKGIYRAYDFVLDGNTVGAHKALLELLHITPEEATKITAHFETVAKEKLKGSQQQKEIAAITRSASDAYAVIGPASKESSRMSTNLAREIDTRAKDIISQVNSGTSDQVGTILRHEMPLYEKKVKDTFTAVKEFGVASMKNSNYRFDFDKLAIEPVMMRAIENIHNPALRIQAESYLARVRKIGGKELTEEGMTSTNSLRSFKDLFDLRKTINEFGTKKNLKDAKDIEMVVEIRKRIDKEIVKAARTGMGNEAGNAWVKQWKAANQGYRNMLDVRKNVLTKAIMRKGTTNEQIARALMKSAMSVDGTYREVMQTLPTRLRAPTENAVLREVVNKFTVGDEAGKQAIDFMALSNQLKTIPFTTQGARDLKRSISVMSRVFRNDPKALAATGVVKTPSFQSYLTVDPVIRLKYEFASGMFNYIKRLSPTAKGREIALVMNVAKVLENPKNSKAIDTLIASLPKDPAMRNQLQAQILNIAKWNEKSVYPEVEVFGSAVKGHSLTPTNGPLGTGIYYYTDKGTARATARLTGGKLGKQRVHPDRIADAEVIREALGLAEGTEITPKLIRENAKLRQLLEDRMYNGIIVSDTVMLF